MSDPSPGDQAALPFVLSINESFIQSIHAAGLPWWATIVASTVALRTIFTLPIAIYQQQCLGRMINLAPMIQSWGETLKTHVARTSKEQRLEYSQYDKELQRQYRAKVKQIYRDNGCGRWKLLLLPYVQMPLFISMSFTVRHLSGYPIPWYGQLSEGPAHGLSSEGIAWFMDLTATDSTLVVPLLIGAGNLLNIELNAAYRKVDPTPTQQLLTNMFRCLAVAFVPISAHVPMSLGLYWLTSSWYSVAQNVMLRVPAVRKALGMPIPTAKPNTSS